MMELRDYQIDAINKLRAEYSFCGHKRQVLCMPTGSGKTEVAIEMIESAANKDKRVIFIVDQLSLLEQTSRRLWAHGIAHDLIQSYNTNQIGRLVTVCSAQTLEKRTGWVDEWDLFIIDEAHSKRKKINDAIVASGKTLIGLTATPFTSGMGKTYTGIVNGITTNELFKSGYLVKPKAFIAKEINLKGLKAKSNGEWSDKDIEDRTLPIVADICSEWVDHTRKNFGGPVKTLLFTPTIKVGEELCAQFRKMGYSFEQVAATMSQNDNKDNIEAFRQGKVIGLASCFALAKGFDVPDVRCIISAKPYRKSFAGHIQEIGRGLRPSTGKEYVLVLDHTGNFERFMAERIEFWDSGRNYLDDGLKKEKKKAIKKDRIEMSCKGCGFILDPGVDVCPECGKEVKRSGSRYAIVAGKMVEYKEKFGGRDIWPDVCGWVQDKSYKDVAAMQRHAKGKFKGLMGFWPKPYDREFCMNEPCADDVRIACDEDRKKYIRAAKTAQRYAKRYNETVAA